MRVALFVALATLTGATPRFHRVNERTPQGRSTRGLMSDSYAFFEAFPASGAGTTTACSTTAPTGARGEVLSAVRATVAECYSNDGQSLTQVPANVPAVSSGTALSSVLGIWKGRAATNLLLRSRAPSNAAWTKTNVTCVQTANGMRSGDTNGASTCTATAPNGTVCQSIVYGAATNNSSGHIKRRTGTGVVSVARDGATYADITASVSSTLWRRVVAQEVPGCMGGNCIVVPGMTSGIANPTICVKLATSGDAVDLDFWQDETGAVPTRPIETVATSQVRDSEIWDFPVALSPTVAGGGFSVSATIVSSINSYTAGNTVTGVVLGNGTLGSTSAPTTYVWLYSPSTAGILGFDTAGVVSAGTSTLNQMWTSFAAEETQVGGYHTGAAINSCQRGVCALPSASTLGTPAFTRLLIGRENTADNNTHCRECVVKNIIVDVGPGRGVPTPQSGPIVWLGDSIIFGNGSMPMTPPVYLTSQSGRGVVAAGVGGNTVAQCGSRWTSTYKARGYSTLVWSCAVNDLAVGTAGATLATAAQAFLAEARAEGMKVIITGVMPWKNSAGWTAGKQTETVAYNSAMSTWAGANGAFYVPTIASMGGGGGDPDVIAVAYESTALDKIHPNAAGAQQLATLVNAVTP